MSSTRVAFYELDSEEHQGSQFKNVDELADYNRRVTVSLITTEAKVKETTSKVDGQRLGIVRGDDEIKLRFGVRLKRSRNVGRSGAFE